MANLTLHNLSIGYGRTVIQSRLCLEAEAGKMICLLGQNGCGKSTLIRTLAGLLPALEGDCLLGDRRLFAMSEQERAKQMAVVLTERLSADRTTVYDVVAMGRYPYSSLLGSLTDADRTIIADALAATEMDRKRHCYFNELSDGEKQRTLIAKALAQQTPFILLDEPTAHLDLPNRIKTLLLLRQLAHDTARTILISTHELDLALQTADVIWLMTPRLASEPGLPRLASEPGLPRSGGVDVAADAAATGAKAEQPRQGGVEVGTPAELTAGGAFQRAFADPHYRFEADAAGRLQIVIGDH